MDWSSRPHVCPHATASVKVAQALERRRARQTYRTIALDLALAPSIVGRLLQRAGLNRLAAREPAEPIRRYEHEAPGDLLHLTSRSLALSGVPGIG